MSTVASNLNFQKTKSCTGDYAHCYGDVQFSNSCESNMRMVDSQTHNNCKYVKKSILEILIDTHSCIPGDVPFEFIGKFTHGFALCTQGKAGNYKSERFDPADIYLGKEQDTLKEGDTCSIRMNRHSKKTIFIKLIDEPFYKWETKRGFYFILLQSEVEKLSELEKLQMQISE
jgi:hypothetical protein